MFSQQHKVGRTGQPWHRASSWALERTPVHSETRKCGLQPQMKKLGCERVRIRNVQLGLTGTVGNQSHSERLIGKISHSSE